MTAPAGGFRVATNALRTAGTDWRNLAGRLLDFQNRADAQSFEGIEGGIYTFVFVPAYQPVVDLVVQRCREGQERMLEIEIALGRVARSYEEEEARNQVRLRAAAGQP